MNFWHLAIGLGVIGLVIGLAIGVLYRQDMERKRQREIDEADNVVDISARRRGKP